MKRPDNFDLFIESDSYIRQRLEQLRPEIFDNGFNFKENVFEHCNRCVCNESFDFFIIQYNFIIFSLHLEKSILSETQKQ